ncbi:MAG: hypothetical protein H6736_20610 [Alphaproteobacteria bacterium]|nr:hypothetical protein [Alphaproteobacteria bacterium]
MRTTVVSWTFLLIATGCKGRGPASAGVEIVVEGSGGPNGNPLQPLTPGMTWTDGDVVVRVGETFRMGGRDLVRVASSALGATSETWLHRDADGLWLDGSAADGLLDTPVLLVPEPVRAGMQWEQRFRLEGDEVEVTGWIERDRDDPDLWWVNRQQDDRPPTRTPYREGLGPHTPLFVPFDPPVAPVLTEEPASLAASDLGEWVFVEAVALIEDGLGRGSMHVTEVLRDPNGLVGDTETTRLVGAEALPGGFPAVSGIVGEAVGRSPTIDDGYRVEEPPWGADADVFLRTEAGWRLHELVVPTPSRIRSPGEPGRLYDAHPDGTVDALAVEGSGVVRRRLGRVELGEGVHLRSAWVRPNGVLQAVTADASGPLTGGAFRLEVDGLPGGDVVPAIPYVRATRWDGDVEVCWTGEGQGSDWTLDGVAPAAVVATQPGCALLVRDWTTTTPGELGYEGGEVTGTVEGIGPFRVAVLDRQVFPPLGVGPWRAQPDGTVVDVDAQAIVRPGGRYGGHVRWPEGCVPDAVEGCWSVSNAVGGVSVVHHGPGGSTDLGIVTPGNTSPYVVPVGGLLLPVSGGQHAWVRADGTQQTLDWPVDAMPSTFDGTTVCRQPADADLVCQDVGTGEVLYTMPLGTMNVLGAHPLSDGTLFVWASGGPPVTLDRTTWTLTDDVVTGSLGQCVFGGELADGTIWAWRIHPQLGNADRQILRVHQGRVELASAPMSLDDREDLLNGTTCAVFADDDLVYWSQIQSSPTRRASVVRFAWETLDWQPL